MTRWPGFHFLYKPSCQPLEYTFWPRGKHTQADALRRAFGVCRISAKELMSSLVNLVNLVNSLRAFHVTQLYTVSHLPSRLIWAAQVPQAPMRKQCILARFGKLKQFFQVFFQTSTTFWICKKTINVGIIVELLLSLLLSSAFQLPVLTNDKVPRFSKAHSGDFAATQWVPPRLRPGWFSQNCGSGTRKRMPKKPPRMRKILLTFDDLIWWLEWFKTGCYSIQLQWSSMTFS